MAFHPIKFQYQLVEGLKGSTSRQSSGEIVIVSVINTLFKQKRYKNVVNLVNNFYVVYWSALFSVLGNKLIKIAETKIKIIEKCI